MSSKVKGKSYTLRQNQIEYLEDRCRNGYSRSRWIREAVDMKIKLEMSQLEKIVKRSVNAIRNGKSGEIEAKLGALDATQQKTLSDFRAAVESELTREFLHTSREVSSEKVEESEVRGNLQGDERPE